MDKMELIFVEEMSGISKTDRPYNLFKLADPLTFENHLISYDPNFISKDKINFSRGQKVKLEGRLQTPFKDTQFVATTIIKVV